MVEHAQTLGKSARVSNRPVAVKSATGLSRKISFRCRAKKLITESCIAESDVINW